MCAHVPTPIYASYPAPLPWWWLGFAQFVSLCRRSESLHVIEFCCLVLLWHVVLLGRCPVRICPAGGLTGLCLLWFVCRALDDCSTMSDLNNVCPICQERFGSAVFESHVDLCIKQSFIKDAGVVRWAAW